jgi:hypothetical protein
VSAARGICRVPGFRVPVSEAYNEPVIWRNQWLEDHPGGTIARPGESLPGGSLSAIEAAVDGIVLASAFTMEILMVQARRAEAGGRCPRHPGPS